jgi:ribonucleoside-diphosphate reductase alpha chain
MEKASSDFCIGLLRGLFDADGCVVGDHSKGVSIRLAQSNLEMLKAVQRILLRLGIYSRIYTNRRAAGKYKLPDGKGGLKEYEIRAQHELVISNDNILRFYEIVGFEDVEKMEKLEKAIESYRRKPNRERFVATVEEIVPEDEEEVYDVSIPGINAFDANGFIVHNCGEQPLLPYESCNLGSINVSKFVKNGDIDWDHLRDVVWTAVRFLDNVIDVNKYPLPEIEEKTKANRKIGLGVMGFADLLFKLKIPYDSEEGIKLAEKLMSFIQEESHKASQALAEERGVFPNWKGSVWEKKGIKIRNATTTTIAPTGTISIIAGCSSGIEPVYALAFKRMHILDGEEFFEINPVFEQTLRDLGIYSDELIERVAEEGSIQEIYEIPPEIREVFKCALDIAPERHVRMQAAFQKYTDNAVSKTINMPNHATRKDVEKAFLLAYELGCKGITVYRDGSREEQVLKTKKTEKKREGRVIRPAGAYIEPRPRPKIMTGRTIETRTGCGSLYVTINEDEHGIAEVFVQLGKSGGCAASQTEAIGRLLSVALRSWINPEALIRQLKGIRCPSIGFDNGEIVTSCADGVAKVLEKYLKGEYKKIKVDLQGIKPLTEFVEEEEREEHKTKLIGGVCPECGNVLEYGEGCMTCKMCGYTKCG